MKIEIKWLFIDKRSIVKNSRTKRKWLSNSLHYYTPHADFWSTRTAVGSAFAFFVKFFAMTSVLIGATDLYGRAAGPCKLRNTKVIIEYFRID